MSGYLDNPRATADSFVDGWLRTGDVGLFDKSGRLFVVDRAKVSFCVFDLLQIQLFANPESPGSH